MERPIIVNHTQLLLHLESLKMSKSIQEIVLRETFTEIASMLNLVAIIKKAIHQDSPSELTKTGVKILLDLVIDLVMGKHRSIKGFLSAVIVEKFTNMLVDNNIINIFSGISSLMKRKSDSTEKENE